MGVTSVAVSARASWDAQAQPGPDSAGSVGRTRAGNALVLGLASPEPRIPETSGVSIYCPRAVAAATANNAPAWAGWATLSAGFGPRSRSLHSTTAIAAMWRSWCDSNITVIAGKQVAMHCSPRTHPLRTASIVARRPRRAPGCVLPQRLMSRRRDGATCQAAANTSAATVALAPTVLGKTAWTKTAPISPATSHGVRYPRTNSMTVRRRRVHRPPAAARHMTGATSGSIIAVTISDQTAQSLMRESPPWSARW